VKTRRYWRFPIGMSRFAKTVYFRKGTRIERMRKMKKGAEHPERRNIREGVSSPFRGRGALGKVKKGRGFLKKKQTWRSKGRGNGLRKES